MTHAEHIDEAIKALVIADGHVRAVKGIPGSAIVVDLIDRARLHALATGSDIQREERANAKSK